MKPDYISQTQYDEWVKRLQDDPFIPEMFKTSEKRDICIASYWINDQLEALKCPSEIRIRIAFTLGRSIKESDPWTCAQSLLQDYVDGSLEFEDDEMDKVLKKQDKTFLN